MVLACARVAVADTVPFEINGELRVRNENDNRDFNSDTGYKSYNLMRTRLGMNVHPAEAISLFVQVQDSRVAGIESPSTIPGVQQDNNLDLHQGYFQVNDLGWTGFGIKAGRMEVRFGNERLLGVTDWDNVGRVFDGGMLTVGTKRVNAEALFANLVERDTPTIGSPDNQNSDATLQGGFANVALTEDAHASADLQVVNVRDKVTVSPDDDKNVLTFGGRLYGSAVQNLDYSVEGAYQTGSQETGPSSQVDIGAYMFGSEVGWSFGSEEKPVRIGAGFDYLSGDDSPTDAKSETFNTIFGDNHKFYGLMDIPAVASVGNATVVSNGGLQDIKVLVGSTVFRNETSVLKLGGEFHNFALAQAGTGPSGLGNEVDVHASWAYRQRFVPTLGFSAFMPGDAVPGPTPTTSADNSYWMYLQGVVGF